MVVFIVMMDFVKGFGKDLGSWGIIYVLVGVDIEVGDCVIDLFKLFVLKVIRFEVCGGLGGFVGLFIFCGDYCELVLVVFSDGVGIKFVIV